MDQADFNMVNTRPSLEDQLESIISNALQVANSPCTRDERKDKIVGKCEALRQALQHLLGEYEKNALVSIAMIFFIV